MDSPFAFFHFRTVYQLLESSNHWSFKMGRKKAVEGQGSLTLPSTALAPTAPVAAKAPRKPRVKKVMPAPMAAATPAKTKVKIPKSVLRSLEGAFQRLNKVAQFVAANQ
jgi:hypothetical protein